MKRLAIAYLSGHNGSKGRPWRGYLLDARSRHHDKCALMRVCFDATEAVLRKPLALWELVGSPAC
eukprot:1160994-Pelagomonas_calceolata.AAC.3